jgi:hypothetical protein
VASFVALKTLCIQSVFSVREGVARESAAAEHGSATAEHDSATAEHDSATAERERGFVGRVALLARAP